MLFKGYRILLWLPFLVFAQVLPASEDPIPMEQLLNDLDHEDSQRCWHAIDALGASGDHRAVEPLIAALKRDMQQRRGLAMAIIPALGRLGDERAVPVLLVALDNRDEDWLGREAAARALGDIGSAEAVPSLVRAAWLADTRGAAIGALASIGDREALEVLMSALDASEDPEVQRAAVHGLVRIGAPAVPMLSDQLGSYNTEYPANHERALAAEVLGRIGDRRAIETLTKALEDPSDEVRKSARGALAQMKR